MRSTTNHEDLNDEEEMFKLYFNLLDAGKSYYLMAIKNTTAKTYNESQLSVIIFFI